MVERQRRGRPSPFHRASRGLSLDLESIQERARLLQEEIVSRTGEATNLNLYIVSFLTAIFLPITLVTGIFGMNVAGLPWVEEEGGFLWVFGTNDPYGDYLARASPLATIFLRATEWQSFDDLSIRKFGRWLDSSGWNHGRLLPARIASRASPFRDGNLRGLRLRFVASVLFSMCSSCRKFRASP